MQMSFLLSKDLNFYKYAKYSAERQGQKSEEEKSRKARQEKLSREEIAFFLFSFLEKQGKFFSNEKKP